jgi:hypothetical protein
MSDCVEVSPRTPSQQGRRATEAASAPAGAASGSAPDRERSGGGSGNVMSNWTHEELDKIGSADELQIAG